MKTIVKALIFTVSALTSSAALSSGLFVGYSQSELTSFAGNEPIDFDPSGTNLLGILDVTDALSISLDYSESDDTFQNNPLFSEYDAETFGGSISYRFDEWSIALSYAQTEERIQSLAAIRPPRGQRQDIDSDYIGMTTDYGWFAGQWQWIVAAGLHYNEWDQVNVNVERGGDRQRLDENGDSSFVSVNLSGSRYWPYQSIQGVAAGFGLSWNQRISGDSSLVAINGRSINQLSSRLTPRQTQQLTNQLRASGGDSYGQAFAFISIEFTEHWLLDLSLGSDIGSDQDSQNTLITLGYLF